MIQERKALTGERDIVLQWIHRELEPARVGLLEQLSPEYVLGFRDDSVDEPLEPRQRDLLPLICNDAVVRRLRDYSGIRMIERVVPTVRQQANYLGYRTKRAVRKMLQPQA